MRWSSPLWTLSAPSRRSRVVWKGKLSEPRREQGSNLCGSFLLLLLLEFLPQLSSMTDYNQNIEALSSSSCLWPWCFYSNRKHTRVGVFPLLEDFCLMLTSSLTASWKCDRFSSCSLRSECISPFYALATNSSADDSTPAFGRV